MKLYLIRCNYKYLSETYYGEYEWTTSVNEAKIWFDKYLIDGVLSNLQDIRHCYNTVEYSPNSYIETWYVSEVD